MFRRNPQERFIVENAICSTAVSAISMAKKSVYCNVTLVFSDSFFNPLREKHMCALQRFSAKCLEMIVKYGYYHRRQKKVAISEKSVHKQKKNRSTCFKRFREVPNCVIRSQLSKLLTLMICSRIDFSSDVHASCRVRVF